jgi:hypothetical protein
MGQILPGYRNTEKYAQPNISYYLQAVVKLCPSDNALPESLETWREIRIVPYTEVLPPTDTQDFAAEFIETTSNSFRTSMFSSTAYMMTLSTYEPPAIQLKSTQVHGATEMELYVEIKAACDEVDGRNVDRLSQSLRKLTFNVETVLRAKTFYSTTPFIRIPGHSMLTLKGSVRLHDEVLKLNTLHAKPGSWQYLLRDRRPSYAEAVRRLSVVSEAASGSSSGSSPGPAIASRGWSTCIRLPVTVPPNLPPTFCSAVVARQYSLITRIKIGGVSTKGFILEIPLQVIYSPPGSVDIAVVQEQRANSVTSGREADIPSSVSVNGLLDTQNVRISSISVSSLLLWKFLEPAI